MFESVQAWQAEFIAVFYRPEELAIGSVWSNALFALLM